MDTNYIPTLLTSIGLLAFIFLIYRNVSGELTRSTYLITTYMYIFTAFLTIVLFNQLDFDILDDKNVYYITLVLSFLSIYLMITTSQNEQLKKHIFWVIFIISSGIILRPVIKTLIEKDMLKKIAIITGLLFFVISFISHTSDFFLFHDWKKYLIISVGIFIAISLINKFSIQLFQDNMDIISGAVSIIFVILLFIDTKNINIMSKNLSNEKCGRKSHIVCADYTSASTSIILDTTNIFSNFLLLLIHTPFASLIS